MDDTALLTVNTKAAFDELERSVKAAPCAAGGQGLDPNVVLLVLGDFQIETGLKSDQLPTSLKNVFGEAQRFCRESRKGEGSPVNKILTPRLLNLITQARREMGVGS